MSLKIQLLIFLVAGVAVCIFAEEATTAPAAEEELGTAPLGASQGPDYSEVPTLELMTMDNISSSSDLGKNATDAELPTTSEDHLELMTMDNISSSSDLGKNATDAELPTTSEDHLETVTLVGIILGTIAAIGVATGIVIALAKKMSGRP